MDDDPEQCNQPLDIFGVQPGKYTTFGSPFEELTILEKKYINNFEIEFLVENSTLHINQCIYNVDDS